jgi:hypothetical protein
LQAAIRGKTEELRLAVESWQQRAAGGESTSPAAPIGTALGMERLMLSTGFLDGTFPIVDAYELKVMLKDLTTSLTTGLTTGPTNLRALSCTVLEISACCELLICIFRVVVKFNLWLRHRQGTILPISVPCVTSTSNMQNMHYECVCSGPL